MPALKVLLAEDDFLLQALASAVLQQEGFEVIQAKDGGEALALFDREHPDLVLTDYDMPVMNGLELIRTIRAKGLQTYVPLVMFTGGGKAGLLQESLEAGAIEFITKPFEPDELRCRVNAIADLVVLHRGLAEAKARDDEELGIAKHVLGRLLEPGIKSMPASFCMETLPTRRINGDACTWKQGLPDVHYGLICDATGHGLTAGISTIPVVEAFLTMAGRNIPLESIYRETNQKLRRMLPTGRFVCLGIVRLDTVNGQLSILNAGMPDAYLWRKRDGAIRDFPSRSLPAGVIVSAAPVPVEEVEVQVGDRLLFYSDGLLELWDTEATILELLKAGATRSLEAHRDFIKAAIVGEVGDSAEQLDDVTWCLWEVPEPSLAFPTPAETCPEGAPELEAGLGLTTELHPVLHSLGDLIPDLMTFVAHNHLGSGDTATLALLITEALTNALDHGVLGLDSSLKDNGFEAYETEKRMRLAALKQGRIRIELRMWHHPVTHRIQEVEVSVEDSGLGFDWRTWLEGQRAGNRPSGRGLSLIQALTTGFAFNEAGNGLAFRFRCS
ncbi:MAG TPA: fused response regulator/phosphatase [Holophagaceae bacterium]|nr:fused response regulator/phosphatase [Holophagaceae bacterium]